MTRPRRLLYSGTVEAIGFFFDFALVAEPIARLRVLALWEAGALVYRVEHGLVLRLPKSRRVNCGRAPGLPLISSDNLLLAAPLSKDELQELAPPAGTILLVRNGCAVVLPPAAMHSEDPAPWLEIGQYAVQETTSLGESPAVAVDALQPVVFEGREKLKGVPKADPRLTDVIRSLRNRKGAATREGTGRSTGGTGRTGLIARFLRQFLLAAASSDQPGRSGGRGARSQSPQSRTSSKSFRSFLLRSLWRSGLGRLLGIPHGRYIGKMMSMFEQGNLLDALRHALPLGGADGIDAPPPLFRTPSPRADLKLRTGAALTVSSSLELPPELYQNLRTLYRNAASRLEGQGKITEAAFVLADLLNENAEAVALLERHGELRLAAELAEGRELSPSIIIRQWILAGDHDRAVKIAQRTGAFAPAIRILERSHPEKAEVLRLLMADMLASSGDYAGAVEVIWPITDSRHIALAWIDRAIEIGGTVGARMLAKRLAIRDMPQNGYYERALALLEEQSTELAGARHAFAQALAAESPNPATRTLARAAVRSLAHDIAVGSLRHQSVSIRPLITLANDGALRADVPPLSSADSPDVLSRFTQRLDIALSAEDVGIGPAYDAVLLPDGKLAVALGESGVRLLTRDGRTAAHFDQPADRLVISDNGDRAIALSARGSVWRLSRIDFLTRRTALWCEARIDSWATSYDGSAWLVATGNEVLLIDAMATQLQALWRWTDVGIGVTAIAREENRGAFLARVIPTDAWGRPVPQDNPEQIKLQWEVWEVSLQNTTVRSRTIKHPPVPDGYHTMPRGLSASGRIADCSATDGREAQEIGDDATYTLWIEGGRCDLDLTIGDAQFMGLKYVGAWCAALFQARDGVHCFLIDQDGHRVRARLWLPGAAHVSARLSAEHLLLADDRGRILMLDLLTGRLLRDLRVR